MLYKTQEVSFLLGPEEGHLLIASPETTRDLNDLNALRTCSLKEWGDNTLFLLFGPTDI